ncbi:MAG: hypothetical protein INH43_27755 [Acidobacteriaceae bacterium]|jgi:hypothetical protein|nr:hypothetical protein [Acidobacteriaceae bacterium]
MTYNLMITRLDADENKVFQTVARGAHRAYLSPFSNGVEIELSELASEETAELSYRLALDLRDSSAGGSNAPPRGATSAQSVNGYGPYELIVRYENIIGQTTACVSLDGAHRMILKNNERGLNLELTHLEGTENTPLRLYLSLREV